MKDRMISDDLLNMVSDGTLPDGWQKTTYSMIPMLKRQYPNATYEEACNLIRQYVTDPKDQEKIIEFAKQFFDESGNQI